MKPFALSLVREANPVPDPDAIVDTQVREQIRQRVLSAAPSETHRGERPARWRRPTVAVTAAAGLLGLAAAAVGASGLLSGSPYRRPTSVHLNHNPRIGLGVVVSGSARLLPLTVSDPLGGVPWGMRVLHTTRGLGCVQVGRLRAGQLGVLGQDGVAGNDHRFHELRPGLVQPWDCVPSDAHHRTFINIVASAYASGPVLERSCPNLARCPAADRRTLAYGLLGPKAVSLTYLDAGRKTTTPTVGTQGAYLIVLAAQPATQSPGVLNAGVGTASSIYFPGLVEVGYNNGRSCRPSQPGPTAGHSCGPVGYVAPMSPGSVAHVRLRSAIRRHQSHGKTNADLRVTFRAPAAITNANSGYTLAAKLPVPCNGITGINLTRDVIRGSPVTLDLPLPGNCPGRAIAHVALIGPTGTDILTGAARNRARPIPGDALLPGAESTSLGTFTFKLPRTNGASTTGGAPPISQLPPWARPSPDPRHD